MSKDMRLVKTIDGFEWKSSVEESPLIRGDVAFGLELGSDSVDAETDTIGGAVIMQSGVVKDNRFEIDKVSLSSLVKLGNESKRGIKMRFGHPTMSNDAMGTFLGRAKNFRHHEVGGVESVLGDLFFDESAHTTPSGDLASYVMTRAASDPDSFGMSVVVQADKEKKLDAEGNPIVDGEGMAVPPLLRITKFMGADTVDEPAATEGLFGFNEQTMVSAELFAKLEELCQRPEFIKRAYQFFERSMQLMDTKTFTKKPKEEEIRMSDSMSIEKLKETYPNVVKEIQDDAVEAGRLFGITTERERTEKIVELALSMPCDVKTETLTALKEGHGPAQAEVAFLKVERDERGKEKPEPTGLKGDAQVPTEKFASYDEAWKAIKLKENVSLQEAMARATREYPELFEKYLAEQKRGKV